MAYVLKRIEDGAYVNQPGSRGSYTKNLRRAQTFATEDQANANKCGNEFAVHVDNEMNSPR